jgi:DNA-binding transcriptional LysR family regulator
VARDALSAAGRGGTEEQWRQAGPGRRHGLKTLARGTVHVITGGYGRARPRRRYFVAVAEELSFTKAATERLFISRPALSKQIRQLEATMRVRLFDRQQRGVRLTPAGEALLPHARGVVSCWDQTSELIAEVAATQRSRLTVGFQTSIGRGLRPIISARFGERQPRWSVDFQQIM